MRIINTINEPIPFVGTVAEMIANYDTHLWWQDHETWDSVCERCASKGWHKAAKYPCGTEPPRREVLIVEDSNGNQHECDPALLSVGVLGMP